MVQVVFFTILGSRDFFHLEYDRQIYQEKLILKESGVV